MSGANTSSSLLISPRGGKCRVTHERAQEARRRVWRSVRFRHRRTWDQRTHEEDGEGEAEERKSAKSTAEPKNTPPPPLTSQGESWAAQRFHICHPSRGVDNEPRIRMVATNMTPSHLLGFTKIRPMCNTDHRAVDCHIKFRYIFSS